MPDVETKPSRSACRRMRKRRRINKQSVDKEMNASDSPQSSSPSTLSSKSTSSSPVYRSKQKKKGVKRLTRPGMRKTRVNPYQIPPASSAVDDIKIPDHKVEHSEASIRAIVSAYMVADLIHRFQQDSKNVCPFVSNRDKNMFNLNDYIFVRGGALRDVMLGRDINDIDLVVNTIGLTRVMQSHLLQYHSISANQSVDCACWIWQRYLRMFTSVRQFTDIEQSNCAISKLETNLVRSDFLCNARFVKDLIMKHWRKYMRHDLRIINGPFDAINTWGYTNWVINIDHKCMYVPQKVELQGGRFDLGDEMSNAKGTKMKHCNKMVKSDQAVFANASNWNDAFVFLAKQSLSPLGQPENVNANQVEHEEKSALITELARNYNIFMKRSVQIVAGKQEEEAMSITLPMYDFTMLYDHQFCDFTVNALRIPLSMVFQNGNYGTDWFEMVYKYSFGQGGVVTPQDKQFRKWNRKGLRDLMERKVIRQDNLSILTREYLYEEYFWRFIKIICKFEKERRQKKFSIDATTMRQIKQALSSHLTQFTKVQQKEFANRLLYWTISEDNFRDKLEARLRTFEFLKIDDQLRDMFKQHRYFRTCVKEMLTARYPAPHVRWAYQRFRRYGYIIGYQL